MFTIIVMTVFITHRSLTGNYPGERHTYSIILMVTTTFVHRQDVETSAAGPDFRIQILMTDYIMTTVVAYSDNHNNRTDI